MTPAPAHNHMTRDVKDPGLCPACDITPTSPTRSALVLTESEWECLRGIAGFYLGSDGGADDSYDLCRRIWEVTAAPDPAPAPRYDRALLVDALVHHWPTSTSGCGCGWAELGRSHPEHVADVYEASLAQNPPGQVDR